MSRRRERGKKAERIARWHHDQTILRRERQRQDFDRQLERQARIARAFGIDRSHEIVTDRSGGSGHCSACGASYLNAEVEPALVSKCRGRQGLIDKVRPVGDKWKEITIPADMERFTVHSGEHRIDFERVACICTCTARTGTPTRWFAWLARGENDTHLPDCPRCATRVYRDDTPLMDEAIERSRRQSTAALIRANAGTPDELAFADAVERGDENVAAISIGGSPTLIELAECSIVERRPAESDYIERVKLGLGIVGSKAS